MQFDMEQLDPDLTYKVLAATVTPRPIAWVTTVSEDGVANAAPYSFFNVMGHQPPTVTIGLLRGPGKQFKDTAANILATGEFVVNLVSFPLAEAMNLTCMDAPPEVDELSLAKLQSLPSLRVKPQRISESPVSFECRVLASLVTGPQQTIVVGRVVYAHVADRFVIDPERCYIDSPALDLVGRLHGSGWYSRQTDTFQMARPLYESSR
jgi:flavin reductase (DIM6/NTAB) family NADH-FMN oxidoreductase RutF